MAEIRRIEPRASGYASCDDSSVDNTIEIENVSINDQLTEITIQAFTCGIFTEVRAWVGDDFMNDLPPFSLSGQALADKQTVCEGDPVPAGCDEGTKDKSMLNMILTPAELGIEGDVIDDFITLAFTSKRCWLNPDYPGYDEDADTGEQVECDYKGPGMEPVDPADPGAPLRQLTKVDEARVAVASYASIYPALIHKIMAIDSGCAACSEMNDALTMDMLIKACTIYLSVDRVEEAWDAYNKARQMSQDYEDLFRKGPSACQTFGGIGCWIIDRDFVVSMNQPKIHTRSPI